MIISGLLEKRRLRKKAQDCLHHGRHVLHMREDLLDAEEIAATRSTIQTLQDVIRQRRWDDMESACQALMAQSRAIKSGKTRSGLVENIEMLVVAIAVAMGLRAYILQPFKIPTGSMQPTLNGITAVTAAPTWSDRLPLKIGRFLVAGEWYREVRAKAAGRLGEPREHARDPSIALFEIGGLIHRIPRDVLETDQNGRLLPPFHASRTVQQGELLWSGRTQRGDHLFVNKVIWNFRKPRRDEVMVFTTDGIFSLEPGTHYIKRMVGLPEERVGIRPPNLLINGRPLTGAFGIDRVTAALDGYAGYQLAGHLEHSNLEWHLDDDQYFALGDNTRNSRDSRYWGPVPQQNLVGPAVFVYWPFTSRWGLIR